MAKAFLMNFLYDKNGVYNFTMVVVTIVVVACALIFVFYNNSFVLAVDFKWYQPSAFVVIALLAQVFIKLNDTKDQTKILESEIYRLQGAVTARCNTLLIVILFYFLSLIILSIAISTLDTTTMSDDGITEALLVPEKYIKLIKLFATSYVVAWFISVINAYHIYRDIADYKAELALKELKAEGRKSAVKRLKGN